MRQRRRGGAALVAALAGVLVAGAPAEAPSAAGPSLAGQLLVATEALEDPRFARTVVYLARHDGNGALGLIVNRPLGDVAMRDLLRRFGLAPRPAEGQVRVHFGGPVQRQRGMVLHTPDYAGAGTARAGALALTTDPAILDAIAAGAGPRRFLFALGHAGWAPGQLEREIEDGYWFTVPAEEGIVFDADHAPKWDRATARRKIQI